ncbi:MAG: glycosyltransferase family 4 protein [Candidatus Lindowbacteria bacterium]|nr:glycosyltransferase family 4 protein [Candidatus Lindowbacteria bacterium]
MNQVAKKGTERLQNVLCVSLDSNLARSANGKLGNSTRRVIAMQSVCECMHIVMRNFRFAPQPEVRLGERCFLYPTNSRGRASFIIDAVRLGAQIIKRTPIDVIYTQDPFSSGLVGYTLSRAFGKPLALSFAGDMIDNPHWCSESVRNRIMNRIGKWLLKQAAVFRVCSMSEQEKLIGMGVPTERIYNIGFMDDYARFWNAGGERIRKQFLTNGFDRVVLFVGRLVKQKNVPNLIEAMKIVSNACGSALLLIIGAGEEGDRLRKQVDRLGISDRVVFVGPVEYSELPDYFAACDIFVLPSLYEGNAMVVKEASAAGRPTVSTNVSGAYDTIISGVTGYVVESDNPDLLAEKLIELSRSPDRAREMGRAAQSRLAAQYNEEAILEQFQLMFACAAGSNGNH